MPLFVLPFLLVAVGVHHKCAAWVDRACVRKGCLGGFTRFRFVFTYLISQVVVADKVRYSARRLRDGGAAQSMPLFSTSNRSSRLIATTPSSSQENKDNSIASRSLLLFYVARYLIPLVCF